MQSSKECALPVITTKPSWQLMPLGTWYTYIYILHIILYVIYIIYNILYIHYIYTLYIIYIIIYNVYIYKCVFNNLKKITHNNGFEEDIYICYILYILYIYYIWYIIYYIYNMIKHFLKRVSDKFYKKWHNFNLITFTLFLQFRKDQ